MNVVVIGGGPAGEAAAKTASAKKASVTLVEKEFMGGVCLNWGCIPSKTLLSFGKKIRDAKKIPPIAPAVRTSDPAFRNQLWQAMKKEKAKIVETLRNDVEKSVKLKGAKILKGEARFASENKVLVASQNGTEEISFDKAIIAVGSLPIFPPPLDAHKAEILDSDRIFDIETVPENLVIVGGGAIGCEFACLFHELGSKVTIIEKTANLIPGEDSGIVNALRKSFEARGIMVQDSVTISQMENKGKTWEIALSNGEKINADQILACVGRSPRSSGLDLEKAKVIQTRRGIEVDSNLRTSNKNIYAVGDVNGLSLLAHAGAAQGEMAAANSLGDNKVYDGSLTPRCLYTWPEVASVGLGAQQAQEKGMETKSQRFFFQASGRALAEGDSEGFAQVISEKSSGKLLGAQIIGPHATELIHVVSVALQAKMTRDQLKEVIFAHPTFSEGIKVALER